MIDYIICINFISNLEFLKTLFTIESTLIALVSVIISYYNLNQQKKISQRQHNIVLLQEVESGLKNSPELLKLHNIDPHLLSEYGVTVDEVLYVLASLRASQLYYLIDNDKQLSQYRENLLRNEKVILIYEKILKEKMISSGDFTMLIDEFIHVQRYSKK